MHARSLVGFSLPLILLSTGVLGAAEPARDGDAADPDPATRPAEVRRGIELRGSREERSRRVYEAAIRKVEPTLVGNRDRLPQYLELFTREFVEDPRTFAINLSATSDADKRVTTGGWVEFEEHHRVLGEFLGHLGFTVAKDGVELLPDPKLGEERFAVATEPCFVYDKPAGLRETFTQCLPGDPLFVLKDVGDGVLLCHAGDGYVGYVAASQLRRVSGEVFDEHLRSRPPASGDRDARIDRAIDTAKSFLGTKYVWGGRTSNGIDCSGLVHESFRAAGVSLPRDADQQSLVGMLVATRWHRSSLLRGDVLFFLGRRGTVAHTALYLGEGKYIEAAEPVVRISTFDEVLPGKDRPRGGSFCFAKRVLE